MNNIIKNALIAIFLKLDVYDLINFNPKNNTNDQPYQIGTVFHLRSELPIRPLPFYKTIFLFDFIRYYKK